MTQLHNRIPNPSFETNLTSWTPFNGTALQVIGSNPAVGGAYMRVTGSAADFGAYVDVPVPANTDFVVGAAVRTVTGKSVWFKIEYPGTANPTVLFPAVPTVAGQFRRSDFTFTTPAGITTLRFVVLAPSSTGWVATEPFGLDAAMLVAAPSVVDYFDGDSDPFAVWDGAANASASTKFIPEFQLTPRLDAPPRVEITLTDLPPTVQTATLHRTAEKQTERVRGAIGAFAVGGLGRVDSEAAFTENAYRAELLDIDGSLVGYTDAATVTLPIDATWVQSPLDPGGALKVELNDTSGSAISRPTEGNLYYPTGRRRGVLISGQRRGIVGATIDVSTDTLEDADAFDAFFDQSPVLLIRTPPIIRWPRVFFVSVLDPVQKPVNVHLGGELIDWGSSGDEVEPPAPGLLEPLFSRDDLDISYLSRTARNAAYASRLARDSDYTLAGAAG